MEEKLINEMGKALDAVLAPHGKTIEEIRVSQELMTAALEVSFLVRELSDREILDRERKCIS